MYSHTSLFVVFITHTHKKNTCWAVLTCICMHLNLHNLLFSASWLTRDAILKKELSAWASKGLRSQVSGTKLPNVIPWGRRHTQLCFSSLVWHLNIPCFICNLFVFPPMITFYPPVKLLFAYIWILYFMYHSFYVPLCLFFVSAFILNCVFAFFITIWMLHYYCLVLIPTSLRRILCFFCSFWKKEQKQKLSFRTEFLQLYLKCSYLLEIPRGSAN